MLVITISSWKTWEPYMIRYPRPRLAARNSPMITPTRARPILTLADRNRAGQHYLEKSVLLSAAQRVDQSDFFRIYLLKAGIKADNGAENSHGDSGYDDGFCPGAQPYDKERGQS